MKELNRNEISSDLLRTFETILSDSPSYGVTTIAIHFQNGFAYRCETTRNESIMIGTGNTTETGGKTA